MSAKANATRVQAERLKSMAKAATYQKYYQQSEERLQETEWKIAAENQKTEAAISNYSSMKARLTAQVGQLKEHIAEQSQQEEYTISNYTNLKASYNRDHARLTAQVGMLQEQIVEQGRTEVNVTSNYSNLKARYDLNNARFTAQFGMLVKEERSAEQNMTNFNYEEAGVENDLLLTRVAAVLVVVLILVGWCMHARHSGSKNRTNSYCEPLLQSDLESGNSPAVASTRKEVERIHEADPDDAVPKVVSGQQLGPGESRKNTAMSEELRPCTFTAS